MKRNQRGFTLIEAVVAFAIFSLLASALYESFGGSVSRAVRSSEREVAWLTAQSLLSQLRIRPAPWDAEQSGYSSTGQLWRIDVRPFVRERHDASSELTSEIPWRAYEVTVRVQSGENEISAGSSAVVLRSLELAKIPL